MEEEPKTSGEIRDRLLETMQRALEERQKRGPAPATSSPEIDPAMLARFARGERALAQEILRPFRGDRPEALWRQLVAMARPALAIEPMKGAARGRSRLGGIPDLSAGAEWPRRGEKPMYFLGQLDLAEVRRHISDEAIPPDGVMSFFWEADQWTPGYRPEESDAWRVVVSRGRLAPTSPPPAPVEDGTSLDWTFTASAVSMKPVISLPGADHVLLESPAKRRVALKDHDELIDRLREAQGASGLTQFLGYPAEIQGDPFRTAHLASHGIGIEDEVRRSAKARAMVRQRGVRRLLFQIDSIRELGMEWADSGVAYFTMEEVDLQSGRWDRTWLVMDSL